MKAKKQNILLSVALGLCLVATGCVGIAGTLHTPESAVAPTIGAQPASQSVTAGQPATFSVSASGTAPLTYQWQKNGVTIGGNTASYTTPPTTSADNGTVFRVSVTNAAGSIMSNAATLTVNAAPVAPSITSQPASVTVTAGQAATFNVSAGGTAPLSYQWQRNGTAISGATGASYTTPATTTAENGSTFAVVVTNSAGSVTSSSATLSVNPAPAAPGITTQPASVTVIAGQPATFSVTASGTAPLSYQWQKNGAAISGATSSSYTTPATTSADNGSTYAVVVSNAVGSVTSNTATLTVSAAAVAPTITTEPANQSVTAGQTAAFFVVATGTAPLSYVWQKNGVTVGGNSASYTTPATTAADNGATFVVVVSNSKGSTTSTMATLTVNPALVAPSITAQPASVAVTAGQTATFSVVASGTAPLSYQWQKNGAAISGATGTNYTTPATTSSDNGSTFAVVVSNSAGNVTSSAATLTVNAVPVAPSITTQPASVTVTAGQTATFSVVAGGTAPLSYQWQKNGAAISGGTSSSYTTPATTSADNGSTFTVVVSNAAGRVTSSSVTLTVNAAPVAPSITTQPASVTVTAGQTATFSVVANGTAPLSYQWQKNGTAISGATGAVYTTPATTASDSGATFRVVVSNAGGSVTSSSATLTVNAALVAPSITTQPTSETVALGQTATFTVAASGTAPLSYQWQKDGTAISGATSASYTTPATTSSDNGATFQVVVSNTIGNVTSSAATLTVDTSSGTPVSVNWTDVHQTIEGFGAAAAFQNGNPWTAEEADLLYCGATVQQPCTQPGIGLTLLRIRMLYDGTYPYVNQAQMALARGARVWGAPWTAPAVWKTNNDVNNGGYLLAADYPNWANYLSHYVTTLKNTYGIPLYAISVQNEPNLSIGYDSMLYTSQNFHDFILNDLGPTMAANNPGVKIIMPEEDTWDISLAAATQADPNVAKYVSIIAAHGYGVFSPGPLGVSAGQEVWQTEDSCIGTYIPSCPNGRATDFTMTDALSWAHIIHNYLVNANVNAFVWWWGVNSVICDGQGLINDSNAGGACSGIVVPPKFWITGNFSRFVRPGYVRIGATVNPLSNVYVSSYKDPASGNFAIVVVNQSTSSQTLTFTLNGFSTVTSVTPWMTASGVNLQKQSSVSVNGNTFTAVLPASSVTTFVGP
jgi:O-glycosyl hydrolase